jgi:hypothetical protein
MARQLLRHSSPAIVTAVALLLTGSAMAADEAPGSAKARTTGSTKPGLGQGPHETSMPSSAAMATTKGKTGSSGQSNTVKTMNSDEKAKVGATGK